MGFLDRWFKHDVEKIRKALRDGYHMDTTNMTDIEVLKKWDQLNYRMGS